MGQHSLMKKQFVKDLFIKWNCTVIERTIYTIATSVALLLLIDNWKFIYLYPLWSINATDGVLWWVFSFTHLIAWSFIYGGAILMDIPELIGIKQVYYNVMDWMDPLSYKSKSLQKLYRNMRHPSFIGFLLIFWICPLMTLDRVLLSSLLSIYMYSSWKTSPSDYEYQQDQFIRKKYSLQ
ncbi:nurim homolog [Chrysoperla carnea]|uniref:nurim homolog n=1 Tax=Chrysoperla carnea TaxID=189513 RepID=UPI001D09277A|nr:nurim homolog [Chrysoperla carnea]